MGLRSRADRPARMHATDVRAGAAFRVVSEPLAFYPAVEFQEGESFLADFFWNDYETRIARYAGTNEFVLFYPPKAAEVESGDRFVLGEVVGKVRMDLGLVRVTFRPAGDQSASE
ncbi:hypothetical protein M0R89_14345 [Halorussus limi]|uniref:Uncharacterized protein n=1 Tax=Halorussus limi TaxID=2938695 RepID=A0A8U0HSI9_9EURY|nr:hypothetical protein [Halorussus limi]UPV73713.1 hypothetical protein M0R89_14345 [Halorussus limi]